MTTSALIFPVFYLLRALLPGKVFVVVLHILMAMTAFLFILDFRVKKPDFGKLVGMK